MKKLICLFLTLMLFMSAGTTGVLAVHEPKHAAEADALHSVGLFRGTDAGYELEAVPSRSQALVMLIRLLGRETEALETPPVTPFSDCEGHWAESCIAFAWENGLTRGRADGGFAPDDPVCARDYLTFLLRALGYSDGEGGDFLWNDAASFALGAGIAGAMDADMSDGFLRDDCVMLTYNSLSAAVKGGKATLIETLIERCAVDRDAAVEAGLIKKPFIESVPVFMYHQVLDYSGENETLYLSPRHFQAHLDYFESKGITPVTLRQLGNHWRNGEPLPEKPVVLSFDDGYLEMYTEVFPRLQEKGFTGTFFVIPAARWSASFLNEDMIREMAAAGMEIGSHTYSHAALPWISADAVAEELTSSKAVLEELTGLPVDSLAYPVGFNNASVREATADAGYLMAVTTLHGVASASQDPMRLPRIRVSRGCGAEWLAGVLSQLGY